MSEPDEGLDLLDTGSAVGTFTTVLLGYDRQEVDTCVGMLESRLDERDRTINELHRDLLATQRALEAAGEPTWAKLGRRAQEILRLSEEQAIDVENRAEEKAAEIRAQAEAEARRLRDEAEQYAADVRRRAQEESGSRTPSRKKPTGSSKPRRSAATRF